MKKVFKDILRLFVFGMILFVMFAFICRFFYPSNEFVEHAEMMINGYYERPENSADVVVVGNSHVYRFWQDSYAWKELGIASATWSTSNMPFVTTRGVTKEMMETQKPKLLVVEAGMFAKLTEGANDQIFLILASMKHDKNRYSMINDYCNYLGIKGAERAKFYIPFIQFHDRWNDLNEGDFRQLKKSYLNSCYQQEWLETREQGNEFVDVQEDSKPLDPICENALRDYLEYCKTLDCEVLFVYSPMWSGVGSGRKARYNYMADIIHEYGFDLVDYNDQATYDTLGLDLTTDIQDDTHVNVKGSLKFTKVLGQYIKDRYDIPDRRDQAEYADWTKTADEYYEMIDPYLNDTFDDEE